MSDSTSTTSTTTVEVTEQDFAQLAYSLARLDIDARAAGQDASAIRSERTKVATLAIHAAVREGVDPDDVRYNLLAAGVLKGTVSKIVTVLNAIAAGEIADGDVVSLSSAYTIVTNAKKGLTTGPKIKEVKVEVVKEVKVEAKYTQKGAIEFFENLVREAAATDVDAALKLSGNLISKFTRSMTAVTKSLLEADAEEAE